MNRMYLYRIKSIHWSGKVGDTHEEFVIADNIQQVIDYCKIDLQDAGMEIEGITKEVPVTKIISDLGRPTPTPSAVT